jgi:pSer/pThr/pTyr-binding forkhead associated (FHA) protein
MNKTGGLDRIKIGRSVDSDVRVTDDISVSRNHACIKKGSNGDYFLEDKKSKFGTLMLVQQPIFLSSK